jgi:hypothetical protein
LIWTHNLAMALIALATFTASPAQAAERVTAANYVEAEVSITLTAIVREVGSNKFRHDRSLIHSTSSPR